MLTDIGGEPVYPSSYFAIENSHLVVAHLN